jgi:RND family efflux transporter MFP subunit
MKNKKLIFIIAIIAACSPFIKLAADANKRIEVELAEIEIGGLDEYLIATGSLTYKNETNLDSHIVSTVTGVFVSEGDRVRKGDVLLELDSFELDNQMNILLKELSSYKVEKQIATGDLEAANRKLTINQKLVKKGLVGKDQYNLSQEVLTNAQLSVEHISTLISAKQAQIDRVTGLRRYLEIKAPNDGLVTQVNATKGENVYPNQMNVDFNFLVSIADNSDVYVDVKIDERALADIYEGQTADIFLAPYPDTPVKGEISFIYPTIDKSSQGIKSKIRIRLQQNDLEGMRLRQNMSCLVKVLITSSDNGSIVPMQAIVEGDDETFVYIFDGEKVKRQPVETGISDFQRQHVLNGLKEGQRVVVGPMNALVNLTDGQYVREIL